MNKKPFGLDIGVSTFKLVWLTHQSDGYILDSAMMSPAPTKGMMSESPLDEEEMAQAIAKCVADAKVGSKFVNIALPENKVYTKIIEMPILSDRELSSAIYWEAEQHIPVPLAGITLVWTVLKRPAQAVTGERMTVLMVGAPTNLVGKYQRILTMAGLTINAVETEILSTIRALVSGDNFEPSLIVSIGSISTSLAIIREGIAVFTYSIPTGGSAISRAISADFGLSPDQAEEYKKTYGVSKEALGGKIGKATEPILASILEEIKKALAYYTEKYKSDQPIKQIFLSGGTARLPGIDLYFTNSVNIETIIANPWKVLSPNQKPDQGLLDNAPDYTIAIGLAMRDYEE
ncbi:MAG: type IV pilus assembly protein PilM [Candidatus Levybacteria bacterium]|nr:type IV pilus assembly protein PilM [Candidatus Levybacteria bacterium]